METAIQRRLEQNDGESSSFTIFRVPAQVRHENRQHYEPRLVSIGPYYRGRDELRAMEQHKWRLLRHFLQRAATVPLSDFMRAVRAVEQRARCCYSERTAIFDDDDDDDGFAEMLLLDGCFILEFFFKLNCREPDALCDVGWGLPLLHSDLLLLENQIPFFVVETLFHAFFGGAVAQDMLVALLLLQLRPNGIVFPKLPSSCPAPAPTGKINHLLHLYHEGFVPKPHAPLATAPSRQEGASRRLPLVIPCVTMLREAGVRFVNKRSPRDMFDITFDSNKGVLELPPVAIDQASLPLLVNLVAFEQSRGHTGGAAAAPLTSYTVLLSSLVRTGDDVDELHRAGIVDNMLSNNDDAASGFFQRLGDCSTMNYDDHLFGALFAGVKRYHDASWHRHKARFLRDHCSNPWSVIALGLAVLAFVFSLFNQLVVIHSLIHHNG
ncbi:hypothetical protein EE612_010159 [Oryza sativa]|uniref:Uncharacterized protein n=1 Tax=Oryza rufipogon TaxID=4529 RepID=A0A0E0NCI7_ORYRU|nr:hypothetical protein EE612_010159 [Oryza sativa]